MHQTEFKPGFEFELRTNTEPDKWEKIKIHPNCANALIDELVNIFKTAPKDFRHLKSKTMPIATSLKTMRIAAN